MTKKDYVAIASQVKAALDNPNHYYGESTITGAQLLSYQQGVKSTAVAIAMIMVKDNPRFERDRFLKACGIE